MWYKYWGQINGANCLGVSGLYAQTPKIRNELANKALETLGMR
jgi:hypothetical protein